MKIGLIEMNCILCNLLGSIAIGTVVIYACGFATYLIMGPMIFKLWTFSVEI